MWKALAGIAPALTVNLAPSHRDGLVLRSPVLTASGTFGFGDEYRDLVDLSRLGAIVTKTVTPEAREGNPTPRTVETPAGMLNSIGLPNPGVAGVLREKAPIWRELPCPVVVSVSAHDSTSWTDLARAFDGLPNVCAIEANLSCPNVSGGLDFSATPEAAAATVAAVLDGTELPVIAKLSPNVGDIRPIARAVEDAGAHAISLINTIVGLVVDVERRRAFLGAGSGGVSGPAIRPVALRFVYEARQVIDVPIVGIGGDRLDRGRAAIPAGRGGGGAGGHGDVPRAAHGGDDHRRLGGICPRSRSGLAAGDRGNRAAGARGVSG